MVPSTKLTKPWAVGNRVGRHSDEYFKYRENSLAKGWAPVRIEDLGSLQWQHYATIIIEIKDTMGTY